MSKTQGSGNQCAYNGCTEQAWSGSKAGFCMYHAEENGQDVQVALQVWDEARKRAAAHIQANFKGWHFPEDPSKKYFTDVFFADTPWFDGSTFHGHALFFRTKFNSAAHFDNVIFEKEADFRYADFYQSGFFQNVTFEDKAIFDNAKFNTAASFGTKEGCGHTVFKKEARFKWAYIRRNAHFFDVVFGPDSEAMFENTEFDGHVRFDRATFLGGANFCGASYRTGRDVVFDEPTPGDKPSRPRTAGKSAYRLAKLAAYARRELEKADLYGYYESLAQSSVKSTWQRVLSIPSAWVRRTLIWLACRPWRLVIFAVLIIGGCTVFYASYGAVAPSALCQEQLSAHDTEWGEAIHFSVVTFTTLGYGDLQPKPEGWFKFVADAEAVAGVLTMALFIVLMTRKYLA